VPEASISASHAASSGVAAAPCTAVIGLQWGDEGKGKVVDLLAREHDAVVRYNGGANAGHSVVVKGERYALHLMPSGILFPGKPAIIGNGVVVCPETLLKEIDGLRTRGVDTSGLVVSDRAHVVMPYHKAEDALREQLLSAGSDRSIGTTKRGIGPAYAEKVQRATAIRIGDLLHPEALRAKLEMICSLKSRTLGALEMGEGLDSAWNADRLHAQAIEWGQRLRPHIRDTVYLLHDMLAEGKKPLFEGANATLLDVDHGTYPYVTSSSTCALGIGAGTGVPPQRIGRILGVMKAYSTRVGAGPFPTELKDATGERIRERGREYGTTTGRPRRCGWLDLVAVRYSAMINGATGLSLMLFDILSGFDELKVCTKYRICGEVTDRFTPDAFDLAQAEPIYETLPGFGEDVTECRSRSDFSANAARYLAFVEEQVGLPIDVISVGPDRAQTILD
jgi:adenylosuccinate synthase